MSIIAWSQEDLDALRSASLLRTPIEVEGKQGPVIGVDGQSLINFSSNNYLGIAGHPLIAEAAKKAIDVYGSGATASRLVCGTTDLHKHAEKAIAGFLGAADARLFSSGYAANVGTLQALCGKTDLILSDALNHASLIDGARLSRAKVCIFDHLSTGSLEALLRENRRQYRRAFVVTETVFSMDGDTPDLLPYRKICDDYDAALIVDEAHALGVFGPQGRGLHRRDGVNVDVVLGTLGKSMGMGGAFVAGPAEVVRIVENKARSYVFSTGVVPAIAGGVRASLELVERADEERARVFSHSETIRRELRNFGREIPEGEGPIVPLVIGDSQETMRISAQLRERGVFIQGIRPPTVPGGTARLRLVATAAHTDAQIGKAIDALKSVL